MSVEPFDPTEYLVELQADIPNCSDIKIALENAESCETIDDYFANIQDAFNNCKTLMTELHLLLLQMP